MFTSMSSRSVGVVKCTTEACWDFFKRAHDPRINEHEHKETPYISKLANEVLLAEFQEYMKNYIEHQFDHMFSVDNKYVEIDKRIIDNIWASINTVNTLAPNNILITHTQYEKYLKSIHITNATVLAIGSKYITNNLELTLDVFMSNMLNLCYIYNLITKYYKQILYDTLRTKYRAPDNKTQQADINFAAFGMYIKHMLEIQTQFFLKISNNEPRINKDMCYKYFKTPLADHEFKNKFADIFTDRMDRLELAKMDNSFTALWAKYNELDNS